MTDPKRLSEAVDASAEELDLLRLAQPGMPVGERAAVWSRIAAQVSLPLPPGAGPATSSGGAVTSPVSSVVGSGKVLAAVALVAALGAGGYGVLRGALAGGKPPVLGAAPQAPLNRVASQPAEALPPPSEPVLPASPASSAARLGAELHRAPPAASPASPASSSSLLREESLAVLEVRRALRAGDAALALRQLGEMETRFPRAALVQEREALMVEALASSGARALAERRAQAFLRRYPKSPYAADVERHAGH